RRISLKKPLLVRGFFASGYAPGMPPRPRPDPRPRQSGGLGARRTPKGWGGVARRGAQNVADGGTAPQSASSEWREATGLDAERADEEEHYKDARRMLAPLAEKAPEDAAVRELYGLTLYRLGSWRDAIGELRAFERLTSSVEQHPVLADCYRALRRWKRVDE